MVSSDVYGIIENEIKSIYGSRLQTQILLSLNKENKTLSQFREITGSTSQAVIPKIRILESKHLIEMVCYSYRLTPIGKMITNKMHDCIISFGTIGKFRTFLVNHQIEWIPEPLLNDFGDLIDSEMIKDTTENIHHVLSTYLKCLRESRQIFVVSSMTSVELCDSIIERLAKGIPVEVVITRDLFDKLDKEPFIEHYRELMQFSNFKLMVTEEYVRVGTTVTENFLSFGLYNKEGFFDMSEQIFNFGNNGNNKALEWGKKFFQYYKDRSVLIKIP